MRTAAYYNLYRTLDYGKPLGPSVNSVARMVNEVHLFVDSRSGARTLAEVARLMDAFPNVYQHSLDCPLDERNPIGTWKTQSRAIPDADWLLECDPMWVFSAQDADVRDLTEGASDGHIVATFGSINLFNGNNIKEAHPPTLPILSRNMPDIVHGGAGRDGCELTWSKGNPIPASLSFASRTRPPRRISPHPGWVYNYEWFSLPLQYELKQHGHYIKGRLSGKYTGVDHYTVNLDGRVVDINGFVVRLPAGQYKTEIEDEMLDPTVRSVWVTHPGEMLEWIRQERVASLRWRGAKRVIRGVRKLTRRQNESLG